MKAVFRILCCKDSERKKVSLPPLKTFDDISIYKGCGRYNFCQMDHVVVGTVVR
jgi:hypothetical protein